MNSFYIDLNEIASKKPRIIRLLLFGAIMCTALVITSIGILISKNSPMEWFILIPTLYLTIYIYFAWITYRAKLFIQADSFCFEYKFGLFKRDKNIILWETIKRVKVGPAYIAFYKKSGRRRVVSISWLPYVKVIEIKDKLTRLVKIKGIPIEIADFIRYTEKKKDKERKE